jgi:hypothetical protein
MQHERASILTIAQSVWNAGAGIEHNAPTLCAVGRRIDTEHQLPALGAGGRLSAADAAA